MAKNREPPSMMRELSDLLVSEPTPGRILAFRPSKRVQARFRRLCGKKSAGRLSYDEQHELNEMVGMELLMQSIKAKIRFRQGKAKPSTKMPH
jgi:hypothetical protein